MSVDYKLIADAGSTKVDWVVIDNSGNVVVKYTGNGLNALLADLPEVENALSEVCGQLGNIQPLKEISYYGAGCATPQICGKMKEALKKTWDCPVIHVSSDLLGAARSLFNDEPGVACILGTGSNSCLYNGSEIVTNIPSLGFILGDEGSGAALGKRLVSDAFKQQLPKNISESFLETFQLTLPEILNKTYRSHSPNRFLASLVPFIFQNIWNPYIYSLVLEELTNFFRRNVAMYAGARSLPVGFIGSIAFNFEKILKEAAASQGYRVDKISQSPIQGLITYHTTH